MKNILVAVDFKEGTDKLMDYAVDQAQSHKANIWIVHVVAPEPDFVGYEVGPQYIRDMRAAELKMEHRKLMDLANEVSYKGLAAEGIMIHGATIEILTAEIEKLNIDLVVIGHHKHGFVHKAFFGRTDVSLIEHVNIPVLVVPTDV
ncbi:universal stress protein [Labilibacter marinus]|uniref:universal stress protein n=1 Tax=Labilibacter marinus TaxID=1477105 RepID=UPI000830C11A|nr:universal stress protein [Labilibacter marinus]